MELNSANINLVKLGDATNLQASVCAKRVSMDRIAPATPIRLATVTESATFMAIASAILIIMAW